MREELLKIIGDESRVITDNIERKYLSDNLERRIGSDGAVVFPVSTQEVSELLKYESDTRNTQRRRYQSGRLNSSSWRWNCN